MTVFYHAKKSGCDDDEAEKVAKAIGEQRYNSIPHKCKRWVLDRAKAIGYILSGVLTAFGAYMGDELLAWLIGLFQ
jgi:hypothetical protein